MSSRPSDHADAALPGDPAHGRLESWKEIAAYLHRSVSTVQRWEAEEGLPVHRLQHAKAGTAYAIKSELDAWASQRDVLPDPAPGPGQTLEARLQRGPVPVSQALGIAAQIADALAAAHKAGIVHQHLNPANVGLVGGGSRSAPTTGAGVTVKLLDFGVAKLRAHGEQAAVAMASVATQATPATNGAILGTLPYMAPEQVQGRAADARTDIWALGAILYEMVTGARAFEATSATSLAEAILEREPAPLASKQPLTPPALERLVRKCLAKAPDDRWDSAHDVADELRWIAEPQQAPASLVAGPRASWRRTALRVVLPSVVIAGMGGASVEWAIRRPLVPVPIVRAQLDVQPAEDISSGASIEPSIWTRGGAQTALTWTPNGRTLVFVGRRGGIRQLYLRDLDSPEARLLAGTEGARVVSANDRSVVFWANGEIRRVPLDGGPAQTLVSAVPLAAGLAAGVTDRVVFSALTEGNSGEGGIWQTVGGSAPTRVTSRAKGEQEHVLPQLLAEDTVLLFTVRTSVRTWGAEKVVAQVLATGERKVLVQDAADARFVAPGHLVFLRRGLLMAVPFDVTRLVVTGPPVAVLDGVAQALTSSNTVNSMGAGQFSVSDTGALAYIPSPVVPYPLSALIRVDRLGRLNTLPFETRSYDLALRLSPEGRRLAVAVTSLTEMALWIGDLTRGSLTKVTSGADASVPRWTPDGQHIAFNWLKDGVHQLTSQSADGSTPPATLGSGPFVPSSWSPDGRHLAGVKDDDIWVVTVGGGEPALARVTDTPEREHSPEFSPDGRWMAYISDWTGRPEVYLKPVAAPTPVTRVSLAGANSPAWNPRGGELFFVAPKDKESIRLMAVTVGNDGRVGRPVPLFDISPDLGFACVPVRCYDVTADGQRFIAVQLLPREAPPPVTQINLILNWVEELKAKVPVR
jgi:eukaryotic-like serine/threonine-protein kinase